MQASVSAEHVHSSRLSWARIGERDLEIGSGVRSASQRWHGLASRDSSWSSALPKKRIPA
jgi:hypothetical protein